MIQNLTSSLFCLGHFLPLYLFLLLFGGLIYTKQEYTVSNALLE